MLRRSILELSRRRSLRQVPQSPYLLPKRQFSASSRQNVSGKSPSNYNHSTAYQKPTEPVSGGGGGGDGGNMVKLVVGGVLISGVVAATAYQILYLKEQNTTNEPKEVDVSDKISKDVGDMGERVSVNDQEPSVSKTDVMQVEKDADSSHISEHSNVAGESQVQDEALSSQQNELPSSAQAGTSSDDDAAHSNTLSEETFDKKEVGDGFSNAQSSMDQSEVAKETPSVQDTKEVSAETETKAPSTHNLITEESPEDSRVNGAESANSLIDFYHLGEKNGESNVQDRKSDGSIPHSNEKEDHVSTSEELKGGKTSKDGILVVDFLEAIHAAEKRQAELDAQILAEEKRTLKEKYEKVLKDARARELMYAEAAAKLDKEINEERMKAAAALKSLQEKAEENLKMELEHKDNETEMQLKKVKELAHAELAAAIASEKASQIEKMAEANLNIDALCMAFYARSEEARQNHSVHKLALGALALEDAISKGLPIQTEIKALHTYLEGIDKDSLLNLVLSSLPEETLEHGTETLLQLNQKFDDLKTPLRHYSLIPPGGGGILSHTVAYIASTIKLKESDTSGDGIESIINRVQHLLAEGELAEAAKALEEGVRGSQAEEVVGEWVKQARNRAITEQALSLLQSYATSISVT